MSPEATMPAPDTVLDVAPVPSPARTWSDGQTKAIYRHFAKAIRGGELEAGDRLPAERELMETFGATRNMVRKAIAALEEDDLVERRAGSGPRGATPPRAPAGDAAGPVKVSPLDVLEARLAIEPGFADLLIARATDADFARMEACLDRADAARAQQEFRAAGYAFHLETARATRNPLIIRIFELIIEARERAGWSKLKLLNDTHEAQMHQTAENRAILRALRERDNTLARRLSRDHLARMIADVTGLYPISEDLAGSASTADKNR